GVAEVLDRDVGLGAVGGDAADGAAVVARGEDVVLDAQSGQREERDLGLGGGLGRDLDEFLVVGLGEAVVEGGAAEAVTVGDLDDGHPGTVEGPDDVAHVLDRELVALVVRAVAQGRVGDPDVEIGAVRARGGVVRVGHVQGCHTPDVAVAGLVLAMSSAGLVAAGVRMAGVPADGGRESTAPSSATKSAPRALRLVSSVGGSNCGSWSRR